MSVKLKLKYVVSFLKICITGLDTNGSSQVATDQQKFGLDSKFSISTSHFKAGMVGAVGKTSTFQPHGPQFDPQHCQSLS